jgi:flagellar biosynthetic protein FlhB
MAETAGERTEAPTQKRRQKALDDGDVLKSQDFSAAIVILAGCLWMATLGPSLLGACKELMRASFAFGRGEIEDFQPWQPMLEAGWKIAPSLGGLLAMTAAAAIFAQAGIGGLRFNGKLWAPKASRINPGAGLKRIFGPQGWIELGKSILKAILLGAIGGSILWSAAHDMTGLMASDVPGAMGALGDTFIYLVFAMAAGLAAIAAIDLPIAIFRRMNRLKMSKQEIKDEHKEAEGNPENKAAQRQRQRQILKGGFRKAVAEAHVVLTNPTHFAVALRYVQGQDMVPVVVAKGRGDTALAIRELAAEMGKPVLEYPTLARAVYYTSREGQEVRDDLYMAIATVLAFIFNINAAARPALPDIDVPSTAWFDENGNQLSRKP